MTQNIPSKDQLVDHDGLDERNVVKHFGGKSVGEAYRMFAESAGLYCEDITYMSVAGLDFYLPAACAYLQSDEAEGDWECASGVMTSLSCVCSRPDLTPAVVKIIREITDYVANHLAKFDADDDWVPTRIATVRTHIPAAEQSGR